MPLLSTHTPPKPEPWDGHPKGSAAYGKLLAGLAFAGVATFAQLYSTQAVLPIMATDLQITAAEAALTISLATVGLAVTVIPWSFLADRIGRVRAMTLGISAATVLGLLAPLAATFPMLLGLRLLEGMALGGIPAIAIAYLNEEVHKAHAAAGRRDATSPAPPWAGSRGGSLPVPWGNCGDGGQQHWPFRCWPPLLPSFSCSWCPRPAASPPHGPAASAAAARTLAGHLRNPRLLALYVQAFLLMGGFVAVYNYLGFRLSGDPFGLPATLISLIFLAYLSGTVTSRLAAGLTHEVRTADHPAGRHCLMVLGLALTLTQLLVLILAGLLIFTGGFFAAHSIGAGWTGRIATTGRAQAASLYNLAYYLGSSVIGWAGGLVFQSFGWTALALAVIGLGCTTAVITAVVHPASGDGHRKRAGQPKQPA